CCISQSFNVRKVRLMITKFARLEFELFTKPSKSDFLRIHQYLNQRGIIPMTEPKAKPLRLTETVAGSG
ncbi:MAG: hypothetical protein PVG37_11590, partial [Desulfobacterales bacterium]